MKTGQQPENCCCEILAGICSAFELRVIDLKEGTAPLSVVNAVHAEIFE